MNKRVIESGLRSYPERAERTGTNPACLSEPTPEPAAQPAERAAAAGLPADLLYGDETILLLLKPHPLYIFLTCLGALAMLAAVAVVAVTLQRYSQVQLFDERGLVGLCLLLASLRLAWQVVEWTSRTYILTDRRVIRIMGVGRAQVFQADLRRIRHTEILRTARERFFSLGTIAFSTVGPAIPEAYWAMVANPADVHETILAAIKRYGK